jgi:N-acyl-D-aspartate/D-glutamate deacylase
MTAKEKTMYDIIITNGTILDGTGRKMFTGDIGIQAGRIRSIGYLRHESARQTLDAGGCFVAPGFVDITNHSDTYWQLFAKNGLESLLQQGVTTIIGGNSGSSLAPFANQHMLDTIQKWVDVRGLNLNWLSMRDFLDEVERRHLPMNFATLSGHATLRRGVLRDIVRRLEPNEIKILQKMLQESFAEGSFGLSLGLSYSHAREATRPELVTLMEATRKANGLCAIHLRNESEEVVSAMEEAILLAQSSGVRTHISHLKVLNEKNWHLFEKIIYLLETAVSGGADISFDVYPYTSTASVLYTMLPDWATQGGKKMLLSRLRDPKLRAEVIEELKKKRLDYSKATLLASSLNAMTHRQNVAEMAHEQRKAPEEIIVDLLVAGSGRAIISLETLSEANIMQAIQHPLSCISSNGFGLAKEDALSGEATHPRNFGAFPKFLGRYVRERQLLGWEEAIRKITLQPALRLGLSRRGSLAEGNWADVVIFDPEHISDTSTFTRPYQYPKGIRWVVVNGEVAVTEGIMTSERVGQVLRREGPRWWQWAGVM